MCHISLHREVLRGQTLIYTEWVHLSHSWTGLRFLLYHSDLLINPAANFLSRSHPLQPLPSHLPGSLLQQSVQSHRSCVLYEGGMECVEQSTWVCATWAKSAKPVPLKAVTLTDCCLCFCLPKWHIFIGRLILFIFKVLAWLFIRRKKNQSMKKHLQ